MLILTPATLLKERTPRLDAIGRRGEDFDEIGVGKILLIPPNARPDALPGQGKGDHHHPPIDAADAFTQIGQVIDREFDLLMIGEGLGMEIARWFGRHSIDIA